MCAVDILFGLLLLFFFKQKTAYEMRISDWSSDVCSSDLLAEQKLFGERLLDLLLNEAAHRARAIEPVIAAFSEPCLGVIVQRDVHLTVGKLQFELKDELFDHTGNNFRRQVAKWHDGIQTVAEFRGEHPLDRFVARILSAHVAKADAFPRHRSEEHTSELQSLMRISYAVF